MFASSLNDTSRQTEMWGHVHAHIGKRKGMLIKTFHKAYVLPQSGCERAFLYTFV